MDNARAAWDVPRMRVWQAWLLVLSLGVLLTRAASADAESAAPRHVDEANEALGASPPRRDAARAALGAARDASDDPDAVAEACYLLGRLDEEDGEFAQAVLDDRAALSAAPGTRWAIRANDRIEWLQARSEDGFAPLARLERVRRNAALADDPGAVEALAHDAEGFPPGMVRVEARMLVAEAWLGRMNRVDDAIRVLRLVTTDPKADPLTARLAERELVDALITKGRLYEANAEASSHAKWLDSAFLKRVHRARTRRAVRVASVVVLLAFAAFTLGSLAGAARRGALDPARQALRKLAPTAFVFVAFVALGGGVLASKYETGNAAPFLALGVVVLPLVLLARAWSAVGSPTQRARIARSALCAATVVAAAFVVLERIDPHYLDGFGL